MLEASIAARIAGLEITLASAQAAASCLLVEAAPVYRPVSLLLRKAVFARHREAPVCACGERFLTRYFAVEELAHEAALAGVPVERIVASMDCH